MKVEHRDGVNILITDQRLDASDGSGLKHLVTKLTEDKNVKLIINMENTVFIDSWGCAGLLMSLKSVARNQGELRIACPSRQVLSVMEMTRLDKVFDIYESLESAIESFLPIEERMIRD